MRTYTIKSKLIQKLFALLDNSKFSITYFIITAMSYLLHFSIIDTCYDFFKYLCFLILLLAAWVFGLSSFYKSETFNTFSYTLYKDVKKQKKKNLFSCIRLIIILILNVIATTYTIFTALTHNVFIIALFAIVPLSNLFQLFILLFRLIEILSAVADKETDDTWESVATIAKSIIKEDKNNKNQDEYLNDLLLVEFQDYLVKKLYDYEEFCVLDTVLKREILAQTLREVYQNRCRFIENAITEVMLDSFDELENIFSSSNLELDDMEEYE